MDVSERVNDQYPFGEHVGLEVTAVGDRYGDETGVVEAELEDDHWHAIAKTRGLYKTSVVEGENPFVDAD